MGNGYHENKILKAVAELNNLRRWIKHGVNIFV